MRLRFIRIFVLPVALVVVAAIVLMNWHLTSNVEIKVTVERVDFSLAGQDNEIFAVLNQVGAQSVGVTKFDTVTFTPKILELADPKLYDVKSDSYPKAAWKILPGVSREIIFPGGDEIVNPSITLEPALSEPLNIDKLSAKSGALISLEVASARSRSLAENREEIHQSGVVHSDLELRVRIHGQEASEIISPRGVMMLISDHSIPEGIAPDAYRNSNELVFRTKLVDSKPTIRINGRSDGITLLIRITPTQSRSLFYEGATAVSQLKFTKEDPQTRDARTSLVSGVDNSIIFIGTNKDGVVFRAPDFLELSEKDVFYIKDISLNPSTQAIDLRLVGDATEISTGVPGRSTDHRLTFFDKIWQNKYIAVLFLIACWLPHAILSIRSAYKESAEKLPA